MSEETSVLRETFLPLNLLARYVGRTAEMLRLDAKAGLLVLTKQKGIRGAVVRADRANAYLRKKHFGRVEPLTAEALAKFQRA